MREDPVPVASILLACLWWCFFFYVRNVFKSGLFFSAWLDFNTEATVSACQHLTSSKVLKSVDNLYKAFIRHEMMECQRSWPNSILSCLIYAENGYVLELLMSHLRHIGFVLLFCFVTLFRPTTLDAFVFGFLAPVYKVCFPRVQLQEHLKQLPNLCRFCDDILTCYFRLTVSGKICFFSAFLCMVCLN